MKLSEYVRPVVTLSWTAIILSWTATILYCVVTGQPLQEWVKASYLAMLMFYFGERSAFKVPGGEK